MSKKTTIISVPLINELNMLIACSEQRTTLRDVGDFAHICPNCGDNHSKPVFEVCQRGLFDHDSMTLVMYCGRCFNGAIWYYDLPHQDGQ